MARWEVREGDALERLREMPDESVQCCVTSPPYFGLRDYGHVGQIGLEPSLSEYVAALVAVFDEAWRVLRSNGTLWLNLGDSYAGSWGAQGRGSTVAVSAISRTQVEAHPHRKTRTGSIPEGSDYKPKDLLGVPWMVAFALRASGWYLRSDIVWAKPNAMPESVRDRPTSAHEHIFLLSKNKTYFYDASAIREPAKEVSIARAGRARNTPYAPPGQTPQRRDKQRGHSRRHAGFNDRWDSLSRDEQMALGRNKRDVWEVATYPFSDAHFATFPPALVEPMVLAGSSEGDIVLDPFAGSGTTGLVALRHGRSFIGIELNPTYADMARNRIRDDAPLLNAPREGFV